MTERDRLIQGKGERKRERTFINKTQTLTKGERRKEEQHTQRNAKVHVPLLPHTVELALSGVHFLFHKHSQTFHIT